MTKNIAHFLLGIFLGFLPLFFDISQKKLENFFFAQISKPYEELVFVKLPKKTKPQIQAKAVLAVRLSKAKREKIIFAKNSDEALPIASLTKLMNAIIVLENPEKYNQDSLVKISFLAANQKNVLGYGNLDSQIGKEMKVKDLLELMLIYSSNDAAFALSEVIGLETFVQKMNEKAKELGLSKTKFFNPHGLDPETGNSVNQSSPKDLVKLARYILENHPLIFEISAKESFPKTKNGIWDLKLKEGYKVVGGKTGYTKRAGGCLLFVFQDEWENFYINVILGTETEENRVQEMQKLINYILNYQ